MENSDENKIMKDENNIENATEAAEKKELTPREARKAKRAAKKEAKRIKEAQKSFARNVVETVIYVVCVVCIALFVKYNVGQPIIVDGASMNDTLSDKDWVWCNKMFYTPHRFDVVIVESEKTMNHFYIKRVIALPGETIYIHLDEIQIKNKNGEMYSLKDPYGYFEGIPRSRGLEIFNTADGGYKLADDEYFVMGDNRYNSKDSRKLGGFKASEIKGHAVCRIWPLKSIGDFDKSNEK